MGRTDPAFAEEEVRVYPALDVPFVVEGNTDTLRISWGEPGSEPEGLVPWSSGHIFVR